MPPFAPSQAALAELRQRIERVAAPSRPRAVLPFGIASVDTVLPSAGLALGAVHELCGGGPDAWRASLSTLFAAGILARLKGPVLWCLHSRDLFAPALARVGLHPDRVIYCETWKDSEVLPAMEDGLRYRGLAGVVGELTRLPLSQSRRLQLAAESSGVVALVLRRSGMDRDEPNAAFSRWRIKPAQSPNDGDLGMGRARWTVELMRCRGAESHSWVLEACDAKGRLALPADLSDGSGAAEEYRRASA
ncbi:MAG: protein ImuA [Bradyrhizobium sp.]|jgi:protein ImuA|nr:protein ImuA [Bradyrhizobium sp.]